MSDASNILTHFSTVLVVANICIFVLLIYLSFVNKNGFRRFLAISDHSEISYVTQENLLKTEIGNMFANDKELFQNFLSGIEAQL